MEPTKDYRNVNYGLITPDGRLFETEYWGHSGLTCDLEGAGILDENDPRDYRGSVHLSDGEFDLIDQDDDFKKVTQAQFNTMFDYVTARGDHFNFNMLEVIDAKAKETRGTHKVASNPFSQVALAS